MGVGGGSAREEAWENKDFSTAGEAPDGKAEGNRSRPAWWSAGTMEAQTERW